MPKKALFNFKFDTKFVKEYEKSIKDLDFKMLRVIDKEVYDFAEYVVEQANKKAPLLTGALRSNVDVSKVNKKSQKIIIQYVITYLQEYANYQHFTKGLKYSEPKAEHLFLTKTAEANFHKLLKMVGKELQKVIK